jgi:hypothetical protein
VKAAFVCGTGHCQQRNTAGQLDDQQARQSDDDHDDDAEARDEAYLLEDDGVDAAEDDYAADGAGAMATDAADADAAADGERFKDLEAERDAHKSGEDGRSGGPLQGPHGDNAGATANAVDGGGAEQAGNDATGMQEDDAESDGGGSELSLSI